MQTVYSALKVFGFPDHAAGTHAALHAPVHVRIKPVNACNERCWFCAYRQDDLTLGAEMNVRDRIPPAKMVEIVDDLIAMGVKAVTFSGGGEPLIYPAIGATVRRLAAGAIKIGCLTNGVALTGDTADALAEHATWVRVSIDAADAASYARSRRVPLEFFDRVIGNVGRFAARAQHATIGFCYIVSADSVESIRDFCVLAKRIGAHHVKLSACVVANDAAENDRYHAAIADVARTQIAAARELGDATFAVLDHYHAFTERFERPYTSCPMLEYLTVIGADCRVYTCQDKAYTSSGVLGSIANRSFSDLWFSPENAERIRSWNVQTNCAHHCAQHAKNVLLSQFRALDDGHAMFV